MTLPTTQDILSDEGFYVLQSPLSELFWGFLTENPNGSRGKFISFNEEEEILLGAGTEGLGLLGFCEQRSPKARFRGFGQAEYKRRFGEFQARGDVQKAVLFETYTSHEDLSLAVFLYCLKKLLERENSVGGYVYGFYDPKKNRALLGLSPEFLHSFEASGIVRTIALAGSQEVSQFKSWSDKLKQEHKMVEDSISRSLSGRVKFSSAKSMRYGELVHLSSQGLVEEDVDRIAQRMHPTAAVGTLPKEAFRFLDLGPEPRGFYGGYAELEDIALPFSLVTIRGLEWSDGELRASIGGGVLKESSFEEEWNELGFKWEQFKRLWNF